jgi:hypothetical protein
VFLSGEIAFAETSTSSARCARHLLPPKGGEGYFFIAARHSAVSLGTVVETDHIAVRGHQHGHAGGAQWAITIADFMVVADRFSSGLRRGRRWVRADISALLLRGNAAKPQAYLALRSEPGKNPAHRRRRTMAKPQGRKRR